MSDAAARSSREPKPSWDNISVNGKTDTPGKKTAAMAAANDFI